MAIERWHLATEEVLVWALRNQKCSVCSQQRYVLIQVTLKIILTIRTSKPVALTRTIKETCPYKVRQWRWRCIQHFPVRLRWRNSNTVDFNNFCTSEIFYFTLAIQLLQKSNEYPTETNKNILIFLTSYSFHSLTSICSFLRACD